MELTCLSGGDIVLKLEGLEIRYPRVQANQLILCARMNDWDKFTALWKRKTGENDWTAVETFFERLDSTQRWKLKEAFARLTTRDEESTEPGHDVTSSLLFSS